MHRENQLIFAPIVVSLNKNSYLFSSNQISNDLNQCKLTSTLKPH